MQALVLCGGLGTRLRSVVSDRPKCLAPVGSQAFLLLLLEYYARLGVNEFVLATGYLSEQIEECLESLGGQKSWTYEISCEPEPLGTGGAVQFASQYLRDEFLVINGDTWMEADPAALFRLRQQTASKMVLALRAVPNVARYGEVLLGADGRISSFLEKGGSTRQGLINAGVYCMHRSVLELIAAGKKVSLESEIFPQLMQGGMYGLPFEGEFIDIGIPEDYALAQRTLSGYAG